MELTNKWSHIVKNKQLEMVSSKYDGNDHNLSMFTLGCQLARNSSELQVQRYYLKA